ncbi:DUF1654 domain-containing protein [Pseudomonas grimontii]|uniref:DUF1654 domain-containing protein n=1 Tax=Pseudomonas grimontii TaxID=129847 RepID=UPI00216787C2|nr:DUF1654 domain-containing protein [Pseudomonas grimontii]MCS3512554.1 hypothetical protein [Pseudomonas grimontii]
MGKPQKKHENWTEMTGLERLGLRVSSMINHPVAQTQRWVTIHQLDTDGEREWDELMGVLSETDGIEMIFSDDGTVTLNWEACTDENPPVEVYEPLDEPAPF